MKVNQNNFLFTVIIIGVFLLSWGILLNERLIFAEEVFSADQEANPFTLKDPFLPLFPKKAKEVKKEIKIIPEEVEVKKEEKVRPPELSVQGLVWGKTNPQAIINHTVVTVGDEIDGVKILNINKEGIKILFQNQIFFVRLQPSESYR